MKGRCFHLPFSNSLYAITGKLSAPHKIAGQWACQRRNGQSCLPAKIRGIPFAVVCKLLDPGSQHDSPAAAAKVYFVRVLLSRCDATALAAKVNFTVLHLVLNSVFGAAKV